MGGRGVGEGDLNTGQMDISNKVIQNTGQMK